MKDIAIYGFGGLGREVACLINSINKVCPEWNLIGYFDDQISIGERNRYGEVIGNLNTLNSYSKELSVVIAIASPSVLRKLSNEITNPNISFPNIIAPEVIFYDMKSVKLGKGNILGFYTRISCDVTIGNFNFLNGSTCFGHDVTIGDCNVFQPETRLSGGVIVGNDNFFGMRSAVIQYLKIGNNTKIGAGSYIFRNTKDGHLYLGNPAKIVQGI